MFEFALMNEVTFVATAVSGIAAAIYIMRTFVGAVRLRRTKHQPKA